MKIAFSVVLASALCANLCNAADGSVSIPVTALKYEQAAFGPLKSAQAYGDRYGGKHGSFVKLPAGFVSPPHTHTEDYYATVISGVIASGLESEPDIPLAPGSYWFQKGKERHVTKCLSANECVFFQSQAGKADFLISK
jgi:quercetin dioxygenase-like cupin family protein